MLPRIKKVIHNDEGINSSKEQNNLRYLCIKSQDFKIHKTNNDSISKKNRQTHNYRDFNHPQ